MAEVRPSEGSGVDMGWIVRRNHEERRQSGMKLLKQFTNRVERRMKVGLAAVLTLAVAAGTGVMVAFTAGLSDTVRSQIETSLADVCDQNAKVVEYILSDRIALMERIAGQLSDMGDSSAEALVDYLRNAGYAENYGFYNMGVWEADGWGYTTGYEHLNLEGKDYLEEALAGRISMTEAQLSEDGSVYLNILTVPIWHNGVVERVLTATYRSEEFFGLMSVGFMDSQGRSLVLNSLGQAVSLPYKTMAEDFGVVRYISDYVRLDCKDCGLISFTYGGREYAAYTVALEQFNWYVMSYIPTEVVRGKGQFLQRNAMFSLGVLYLCILAVSVIAIKTYKRLSRRIVTLAFTDELTQAKNYEYLRLYFRSLSPQERAGKYLVAFDVDRQKFINLLYGWETGDRILKLVVQTFVRTFPKEHIFKGSADGYCAVLDGACEGDIEEKIQRFLDAMAEATRAQGEISVSFSFGICPLDGDESLRSVYDKALLAKREAKGSVDKKYKFFGSSERKRIAQKEMEEVFDQAVKEGQFQVWYQPKFDMRTGKPCGSEALVRWKRPEGGVVAPGEFIPLLEENGRIVDLDRLVLQQVCEDLVAWEGKGLQCLPVSVNLSKIHLKKQRIVEDLWELVERSGADQSKISFEITESAMYGDVEELNRLLRRIQSLGFEVDMDDYGLGSSTLHSLAASHFDTLKLDKSFISAIGSRRIDVILDSTIQMANDLGMKVVAEGVETQEQVDFLLAHQCWVGQGYYFSKPVERCAYEAMLQNSQEHG